VQRVRNDKGVIVDTAAELVKQYENFMLREKYHGPSTTRHRNSQPPILQQFSIDGCQNVQSITGFIDRSGELFVTRRSVKVFQRSQPVGVGVCHEALSASSTLTQAVYDLCRKLQYFGVFEVEFIRFGDRWTLIDFNPRFYNQMGLDIRRGMPLPMLAYLDASGQRTALRAAVANARIDDNLPAVFCDRFTLSAILLARTAFWQTARADRAYWRAWTRRHAAHCADVAFDYADPLPAVVHAFSEISLGIKSLPRFVRGVPRGPALSTGTARTAS
jgi:predicted ATP-grasp superfamily ATP-dependent carboligase